ncbi:PLC-like phosphodiesterase [Xylariomycetidae sp. FL2044]|nr:PLC-like phosphodiesterase [Xylariomycetidae sp. FL2044]
MPLSTRSGEQTPLLGAESSAVDVGSASPSSSSSSSEQAHRTRPDTIATTIIPTMTSTTAVAPPPQAIAHRGFKALAPENTLLAFRAAVEVGAHAIETDLHLTRDGVVVLSHDGTLRRCFGDPARVRDVAWDHVRALRTLRAPRQPMPRLLDLLALLNEPGAEHVWVMLDIKLDDDGDELVRRTAETLASVPGVRPWSERITPCCWNAKYVDLCKKYLPEFRIAHVGFSTSYARSLLGGGGSRGGGGPPDEQDDKPTHSPPDSNGSGGDVSSISMYRYALTLPLVGRRFRRDMRRRGVPVHAWTVNDEDCMEWCVREGLAGVITDDPKKFLEVCAGRAGRVDGGGGGRGKEGLGKKEGKREMLTVGRVYRGARFCLELVLFVMLYMFHLVMGLVKHGRLRPHL